MHEPAPHQRLPSILIVQTTEKQTATSLMGLKDQFKIHLSYGNGSFLDGTWLGGLVRLVMRLTRAPPGALPFIKHIPFMMVRRALSRLNRIPPLCALYHLIVLNKLQHQTMKYIATDNLAMRIAYILSNFMADVQIFLHDSANITASLETKQPVVTLAAAVFTTVPDAAPSQYHQGTPGAVLCESRFSTPPITLR